MLLGLEFSARGGEGRDNALSEFCTSVAAEVREEGCDSQQV